MNEKCVDKEQNLIDGFIAFLIIVISLITLACNLQASEVNADEDGASMSNVQEQSQQAASIKERYKQITTTSGKTLTSDVSDTEILEAFRRHERLYCGNNIVSKRLNWRLENGMLTKSDVFYLPSNCSILR